MPARLWLHRNITTFFKYSVIQNAKIMDQCFTLLHWWFSKHRTHPVIQQVLMIAIRAWINDMELPMDLEVPTELHEWGTYKALKEQSQLGWNNFMKGRITPKFGRIQMKAYEQDNTMENIPVHYSATWWTAGLIKEIIYLSLNVWQQRNMFLHKNKTMTQAIRDRTEALQEVAEWYEKKHMFPRIDQVHFHKSFLERCSNTTTQSCLWLQNISDIYEYNSQRRLQDFFMHP